MNKLRNKLYHAVDVINPFMNGLFNGSRRNNINIFSETIVIFGKNKFSLQLFNASHVDGGDN